jgi:ElaB/YqjD/DUF883 family membrane-anchored ribosome-binding protein
LVEKEPTNDEGKSSEGMAALRKDLDKRFADLNSKISDSVDMGKKMVEEKPFLALALAFVLGIIVGALLGRKSKD